MFREKIKNTMTARKISTKALAAQTGILASSISSFLSGQRNISNGNLEEILKALGLTLVRVEGFKYEPCRVKDKEELIAN